ncbi:MAG: hypothetical protein ACK6CU_27765 [Deltaproteobacteria bacterium]|jgi:hypothetical protein
MENPAPADLLPFVYVAYGLVSVGLTIWLARTLGHNGRVFLEKVFADEPAFGDAVNRLLVVGFYLVNFGYACLHLSGGYASTVREAIEVLANKLGSLLLVLAAMHFGNLFVFNRIRKSAARTIEMPPVAPQLRLARAASSVESAAPAHDAAPAGQW